MKIVHRAPVGNGLHTKGDRSRRERNKIASLHRTFPCTYLANFPTVGKLERTHHRRAAVNRNVLVSSATRLFKRPRLYPRASARADRILAFSSPVALTFILPPPPLPAFSDPDPHFSDNADRPLGELRAIPRSAILRTFYYSRGSCRESRRAHLGVSSCEFRRVDNPWCRSEPIPRNSCNRAAGTRVAARREREEERGKGRIYYWPRSASIFIPRYDYIGRTFMTTGPSNPPCTRAHVRFEGNA